MKPSTEQLDSFEAQLTLRPTEKGGRTTPIGSGYMPNWWLPGKDERELASAALELVDPKELAPGATGKVRIYPFAPELWQHVEAGNELEMTEGPRHTVGSAKVTRVVPPAVAAG
jgi:hypothetical protein